MPRTPGSDSWLRAEKEKEELLRKSLESVRIETERKTINKAPSIVREMLVNKKNKLPQSMQHLADDIQKAIDIIDTVL